MLTLKCGNALVNLLLSLMHTSSALLLMAVPHRPIKIIHALSLNVLRCRQLHGRYHFAVFPKILIEYIRESDRHLTIFITSFDGNIQGHHKVSFLREMATIVALPPFCLILCERSDAWMTLCFLTRARETLVAHHPIPYYSGPLHNRSQP